MQTRLRVRQFSQGGVPEHYHEGAVSLEFIEWMLRFSCFTSKGSCVDES